MAPGLSRSFGGSGSGERRLKGRDEDEGDQKQGRAEHGQPERGRLLVGGQRFFGFDGFAHAGTLRTARV